MIKIYSQFFSHLTNDFSMRLKLLILIVLLCNVLALCDENGLQSSTCQIGFSLHGSFCYKIMALRKFTYQAAFETCDSLRSVLVEPTTANEQRHMQHLFAFNGDRSFWVGLRYEESRFVWSNNIEVGYTNWKSDFPLMSSHRRCVIASHRHGHKWVNVDCSERHLFACQQGPYMPPDLGLQIESRSGVSFTCENKFGYFANDSDCTSYILCLNNQKFVYNCADGSVFVASRSRCETGGICLTNATPISPTAGTATLSSTEYTHTTDTIPINCPEGYTRHQRKCYKLFRNFVTWNVANKSCIEVEGGRLVMLDDANVAEFVHDLVNDCRSVCERSGQFADYWIGLNDFHEPEQFVWSDGTTLDSLNFENWSERARKRYKELKQCVKLSRFYDFQWMDSMCNNANAYVCEKDGIIPEVATINGHNEESNLPLERNTSCGYYRVSGRPRIQPIIGGIRAAATHHPWQISLRTRGAHKCGASLINQCWALTAAHCVALPNVLPRDFPTAAVLGDYDTTLVESTEEEMSIRDIHTHPDWTAFPIPTNDIALMRLRNCSKIGIPVCLPKASSNFPAGTRCVVSGYGTTNPTREVYPDMLQEATVPLIAHRKCVRMYSRVVDKTYMQDSMLCAGYIEGGVDSCQGDSGGPLVCTDPTSQSKVQIGIVSWGNGCAKRNRPGVYTKISHFTEWIESVINHEIN